MNLVEIVSSDAARRAPKECGGQPEHPAARHAVRLRWRGRAAGRTSRGASEIDALFSALGKADNEEEAKPIEDKILAAFLRSGSATVDLLMTPAAAALQAGDNATAKKLIASVTDIAPDYAEAWHQRGVMQADAGDDQGAMFCLQKPVTSNPRRFEALSELASKLEEYGDRQGRSGSTGGRWRSIPLRRPGAQGARAGAFCRRRKPVNPAACCFGRLCMGDIGNRCTRDFEIFAPGIGMARDSQAIRTSTGSIIWAATAPSQASRDTASTLWATITWRPGPGRSQKGSCEYRSNT